eukprot:Protomagalhaensia_sp_Gyna_25__2672@NODE_2527_length_1034_cov_17_500503_g2095_i0_p1_GENE_NODE_2527_length_1034_cov_17_500503_g2095_i0NODE_2527_length_1034_cov_17_500503_g2095_i0_p1_ORF_typecomplete_len296_score38_39Stk19/PF10494_9/1_7e05_NODE_2527_length_1034_cov_17_500503_g2095_i01461003
MAELLDTELKSPILRSFHEAFTICQNEKAVPYTPTKKRKFVAIEEISGTAEPPCRSPICRATHCPLLPTRLWTDVAETRYQLTRKSCLVELQHWINQGRLVEMLLPSFSNFNMVAFPHHIVASWRFAIEVERKTRTAEDDFPDQEELEHALKKLEGWIRQGQGVVLNLKDFDQMGLPLTPKLDSCLCTCGVLISRGKQTFQVVVPGLGILASALRHHSGAVLRVLKSSPTKELSTKEAHRRLLSNAKIPTDVKRVPLKWVLSYLQDSNLIRVSHRFHSSEVLMLL